MSSIIIEGKRKLSGSIQVYGSKNASLPLLAASLLTSDRVSLTNIPSIADVQTMATIMRAMGCEVEQNNDRYDITANHINPDNISPDAVGKLRGSILLLGALLGRNKSVHIPKPGGDIIGARPIDTHLDGFKQLGARIEESDTHVSIDGKNLRAGTVILKEFSVTATENLLLTCAALPGTSVIHIAATEPHVEALADLLNAMGAHIEGAGTHTITIQGSKTLHGASYNNIQDMLEAGLFILMGALTQSEIEIVGVPVQHLLLFFKKLDDIGITYKLSDNNPTASVIVSPSTFLSFTVQSLPFPGLATDLQSPFAVIATQAHGSSLIHDPMYEDRFKHVFELQKMGADAVVCDPHRVIITGPSKLTGKRIPSIDIRSGATLVMAGLIAEGQTIIDNAEIIDRGYANLTERLQKLGAVIERKE